MASGCFKNSIARIAELFRAEAVVENNPQGANEGVQGNQPEDVKAFSSSVTTLAGLVRHQKMILNKIASIEANGEAIADAFVKHMTFAIGFVGAGLVFGQEKLPCHIVMAYVWLNFVVFIVAAIYAGSQMHTRVRRLRPQLRNVGQSTARLFVAAEDLLAIEEPRSLGPGIINIGNEYGPFHDTLTAKKLVDQVRTIRDLDMSVTIGSLSGRTICLTAFYGTVYGVIILFLAIFAYCDAKKKCNAVLQDL